MGCKKESEAKQPDHSQILKAIKKEQCGLSAYTTLTDNDEFYSFLAFR